VINVICKTLVTRGSKRIACKNSKQRALKPGRINFCHLHEIYWVCRRGDEIDDGSHHGVHGGGWVARVALGLKMSQFQNQSPYATVMNLVMLNFASHRFDPFHDGVDVYLNILTESQIHRPRSVSRLQPGNHLVSGKEAQLVPNVAL
jgi:hypothetical protein